MAANDPTGHVPRDQRGFARFEEFDSWPPHLRRFFANLPFNVATDDVTEALRLGYTPEQIMHHALRCLNERLVLDRHEVWRDPHFPPQTFNFEDFA